jgi:hypothetical protein
LVGWNLPIKSKGAARNQPVDSILFFIENEELSQQHDGSQPPKKMTIIKITRNKCDGAENEGAGLVSKPATNGRKE